MQLPVAAGNESMPMQIPFLRRHLMLKNVGTAMKPRLKKLILKIWAFFMHIFDNVNLKN